MSKDTHLGDKTINEHKEARSVGTFRKGEGLQLAQTRGWSSGVACQALFLHLPGDYQGICFLIIPSAILHLFCVVLHVRALFYHKNFSFKESAWDSHYLQPFRNFALGCLVINDGLPYSLREKVEIHQWGCLTELRGGKEALVMVLF